MIHWKWRDRYVIIGRDSGLERFRAYSKWEIPGKKVAKPVAVRYAYNNRPIGCYLYNKAGLPASPFTTENGE